MEISNESLMTTQGQFSLGMYAKTLDVTADLAGQLMNETLESTKAMNQVRASQGIGTNLDITV